MSAQEHVATLFAGLLGEPSEAGLARLRAEHPDAVEAVLAYLRDRHARGIPPSEAWEGSSLLYPVLGLLLDDGTHATGDRLVALALEVGHPRELRWLAELVTEIVAPDRLARALIAALGPERSPLTRGNARELAYFTFDAAGEDYVASPSLQATLAALRLLPDPRAA